MASHPVQEVLDSQNWVDTGKRLTLYAFRKLSKAVVGGQVPSYRLRQQMAEDVAEEVIIGVIAGKRSWDPEQNPNFMGFLMSVADSKISHFLSSAKNRTERQPSETDPEPETREGPGFAVVYKDIRARLERETDLVDMLDAMWAGCCNAGELAEVLGVFPEQAVNVRKRLRRRVEEMGYLPQEVSS